MSTQIQAGLNAAIPPGDILVSRQPPGVRMQHSLLKGFYLQDLLIEPASGRVSGPGVETHLKPKAVEVLLYLAERPFELVGRDELRGPSRGLRCLFLPALCWGKGSDEREDGIGPLNFAANVAR